MKVYLNEFSKTGLCITVKGLRMVSQRNTLKSFKCDRDPICRLQIWIEISHRLGLQKSTVNQIRLNEMLVLDMWQPEMCFDRLENQP